MGSVKNGGGALVPPPQGTGASVLLQAGAGKAQLCMPHATSRSQLGGGARSPAQTHIRIGAPASTAHLQIAGHCYALLKPRPRQQHAAHDLCGRQAGRRAGWAGRERCSSWGLVGCVLQHLSCCCSGMDGTRPFARQERDCMNHEPCTSHPGSPFCLRGLPGQPPPPTPHVGINLPSAPPC